MYELVYDILIVGHQRSFSVINPTIELGIRYGYLTKAKNEMMIANKIFEMVICDYFISKDEAKNRYVSHGIIEIII